MPFGTERIKSGSSTSCHLPVIGKVGCHPKTAIRGTRTRSWLFGCPPELEAAPGPHGRVGTTQVCLRWDGMAFRPTMCPSRPWGSSLDHATPLQDHGNVQYVGFVCLGMQSPSLRGSRSTHHRERSHHSGPDSRSTWEPSSMKEGTEHPLAVLVSGRDRFESVQSSMIRDQKADRWDQYVGVRVEHPTHCVADGRSSATSRSPESPATSRRSISSSPSLDTSTGCSRTRRPASQ